MRLRVAISTLLLLLVLFVSGNEETEDAKSYLAQFGYIDDTGISVRDLGDESSVLENAVKDFQHFAGIELTGKLDALTLELIKLPRCGVKDNTGGEQASRRRRRKRRYTLEGSRWKERRLTWAVTEYPRNQKLTNEQVDDTFQRAFDMWSAASSIEFVHVESDDPKINIKFVKRNHGDQDPFDGPGKVLAHAYFPQYGGDMHVDDEENWTLNSYEGTNLLQAVLHELGHSLGLSHSNVADSIMAPFYRAYDPAITLKDDDVQAVTYLYSKNGGAQEAAAAVPAPPVQPPSGGGTNEFCNPNFSMDAIFATDDNSTYFFSGRKYWRLTKKGVEPGYPKLISTDWPGIPNDIDAAFTWPSNRQTYFFKGSKYWKFHNQEAQPGFPKDMSVGFPGIPPDVDSVFVWGGNGKIYFTKDQFFWKFDPDARPYVRSDKYPAPLSQWGVKGPLSAAFQWTNGHAYLFRDREYWRLDDYKLEAVNQPTEPFPRNVGKWWFGCETV